MTKILPPEEQALAALGMHQRWFMDSDILRNEYLIPADRRLEWDAWQMACYNAEELLPAPAWARPLRDQVRWVEFEMPMEVSL